MKSFIFFIIFFSISSSSVFASDVVINEVLANPSDSNDASEYIEIYNKSDQDIDLTNWQLDDIEGGSKPFKIEGKIILKKGFLVFYKSETGIALNNSGDEKARLINPDSLEIDNINFKNPKTDIPLGRVPDGSGNTIELSELSPGSSNGDLPSPTPSPTSLPTPSATPIPTSKPISTLKPPPTSKISVPTLKVSDQVLSSQIIPKNTTPTFKLIAKENFKKDSPTIRLDNDENKITEKPEVSKKPQSEVLGVSKTNYLSRALIGIGMVLILACGILGFRSWRMKKET